MHKKLYVLDDDVQFADLLAEVACERGWDVIRENDALKFVNDGIPMEGVLILDLIMPDKDGIEIIQEIATLGSRLELVLVSGFDQLILQSAEHLAKAHNIHVHANIEKPFDLTKLRQLLDGIEQTHGSDN